LFRVCFSLELGSLVSWIWGFLGWTGLTSVLYQPDLCRGLFCGNRQVHQLRPVWPVKVTGLTGAGMVLLELLFSLRSWVVLGVVGS
jgi:hypothetical protein